MKAVKYFFAGVGFAFFVCWLGGSLGIGEFRFYYGPENGCDWCSK